MDTPVQTLAAIGSAFDITKERVRQIEKKAVLKLRDLVF